MTCIQLIPILYRKGDGSRGTADFQYIIVLHAGLVGDGRDGHGEDLVACVLHLVEEFQRTSLYRLWYHHNPTVVACIEFAHIGAVGHIERVRHVVEFYACGIFPAVEFFEHRRVGCPVYFGRLVTRVA